MPKIYTKTGDNGETHLYGGVRVKKNSKIIGLLGEIDELNSFISFAWHACGDEGAKDILKNVQIKLYKIGAELAGNKEFAVNNEDVVELEKFIDGIFGDKELGTFVRPGEKGECSARIHLCRTICRKAERSAVKFAEEEAGDVQKEKFKYILQYLNRLSDLLFAIAELK